MVEALRAVKNLEKKLIKLNVTYKEISKGNSLHCWCRLEYSESFRTSQVNSSDPSRKITKLAQGHAVQTSNDNNNNNNNITRLNQCKKMRMQRSLGISIYTLTWP